jgi:hypothetical protein
VDIRLLKGGRKRVARYLATQYLSRQSFERLSWSWKWVCKAFVKVWHGLVSMYGYVEALRRWDHFLCSPEPKLSMMLPLWVWDQNLVEKSVCSIDLPVFRGPEALKSLINPVSKLVIRRPALVAHTWKALREANPMMPLYMLRDYCDSIGVVVPDGV